jgi:flagellar basal body-associated protein FliL
MNTLSVLLLLLILGLIYVLAIGSYYLWLGSQDQKASQRYLTERIEGERKREQDHRIEAVVQSAVQSKKA